MMAPIKYVPPLKRRYRIKNKKRFTAFIVIVIISILAVVMPTRTDSQVSYRPYEVAYRDTYWDIAKKLQAKGYKANKDIRIVVDELIKVSGIPAHELMEGDTIYIPDIEGD